MSKDKKQIHNFSAGPSKLPEDVIRELSAELPDYKGTGCSLIEISHRSKYFEEILHQAEEDIRKLMSVPDNYCVLFTHGGASANFSMVPLNLRKSGKAGYIDTGVWSEKAYVEAAKFITTEIPATSKPSNYDRIPAFDAAAIDGQGLDYVHITTNNTIFGSQFQQIPSFKNTPLVADMSSDIMGRVVDIERFGLVYAGLQKNLGPSGMSLVIARKDLIDNVPDNLPKLFSYKTYLESDSMFNTPNTFAIYALGKVMKWLLRQGGITAIEAVNRRKAELVYNVLDSSKFYTTQVKEDSRSIMNVVFHLPNDQLTLQFIEAASQEGLKFLKGHKTAGGIRASMYNALPLEAAQQLAGFMKRFEQEVSTSGAEY